MDTMAIARLAFLCLIVAQEIRLAGIVSESVSYLVIYAFNINDACHFRNQFGEKCHGLLECLNYVTMTAKTLCNISGYVKIIIEPK